MKVTIPNLPGWTFEIERKGCFRFASAKAPNGYTAYVGQHHGNPDNVLFMLIEELLLDKEATSSTQSSA